MGLRFHDNFQFRKLMESVSGAWLHLINQPYSINEACYVVRTTLSAPSFAAFPNVSYAFMMSFIAKR